MRRAHPVEAIRDAERPLIEAAAASGDSDAVMRRAAAGVAHHTVSLLRERTGGVYGRAVLLLVGAGDNGGDALYAGAMLRGRGCRVDAVLLDPDRVHPRGLAALRRAGGRIHPAESVEPGRSVPATPTPTPPSTPSENPRPSVEIRYSDRGRGSAGRVADFVRGGQAVPDVAVDGVVGLGGRGPLRAPADGIVSGLVAAGVPWVAVDLPSGVDADTGTVHDAHVPATLTVTFGLLRRAHLLGSPACGRVEVVDIGLSALEPDPSTVSAPDPAEVGRQWPVPGPDDDKYTQGVVAIRAGSVRYPGAAVLCTGAAVAATSGMVRYVGSAAAADAVVAARPEVVWHPSVAEAGRAQAWVIGPGAGTDPEAVAEVDAVLSQGQPALLDADALTCVAEHPVLLRSASAPVLLTPHGGEFDRLTGGRDRDDRAGALRRYVAGLRERGIEATVLLKGRVTLVDDGESAFAIDAGSSWAATAGSGDVLAGIAGALLAGGRDRMGGAAGSLAWSAVAAAVAHGAAARAAATRHGSPGAPIGASDLLTALSGAVTRLRGGI